VPPARRIARGGDDGALAVEELALACAGVDVIHS
jgi:hypothetical protein